MNKLFILGLLTLTLFACVKETEEVTEEVNQEEVTPVVFETEVPFVEAEVEVEVEKPKKKKKKEETVVEEPTTEPVSKEEVEKRKKERFKFLKRKDEKNKRKDKE